MEQKIIRKETEHKNWLVHLRSEVCEFSLMGTRTVWKGFVGRVIFEPWMKRWRSRG